MSSTLLTLVNTVLDLTGDAKPVGTVQGSAGRIAERITQFLNLTIGAVEGKTNWGVLRTNASGVADGVNDVFDFGGIDDVRSGGAVSVWIAGLGVLQELTAEQFDMRAAANTVGRPLYFQRGVSTLGKLEVQIIPKPANGDLINISAYRRASRFSTADDLGVTEFNDDVLIYGALMHMDSYDQINRGYAALFQNQLGSDVLSEIGNTHMRVEVEGY